MKKNFLVLLLFVGLTIIMNYPRTLHLTNTLDETGDSLLNTWTLAWNVHKLSVGMNGYFDGNFFSPHKRVLAYSEHLFATSLLAFPVIIITKNPILAYNFIWFISFAVSGWGTYLLVNYLVKNRLAGVIAGIIFAFLPFRYAHLGHLQLLTSQWIPFVFLFLHKFFDNTCFKNIFLFTLFYILTVLSCGYYALFVTVYIGLYILTVFFYGNRKIFLDHGLKRNLTFFALTVLLTTGPFFYQYYVVKKNMGFSRSLDEAKFYSADVKTYLSTSPINRVYGKISEKFLKPEGGLFTGITPIVLCIIGLWGISSNAAQKKYYSKRFTPTSKRRLFNLTAHGLNFAIVLYIIIVMDIFLFGGFHIEFLKFDQSIRLSIKESNLEKNISILSTFIIIRCILSEKIRTSLNSCMKHLFNISQTQGFYLVMLISAFLFSLGPVIHFFDASVSFGPYLLLYYFVPGFDGLRVPARFAIMVGLALSVLSGYGVKKIANKLSNRKTQMSLCFLLSFLVLLEFYSGPLRLVPIKTGADIPSVYKWFADMKEDAVIVELPMTDVWQETPYMYYSTYHWKKLVNGYSGYFPPAYLIIKDLLKKFPSPNSLYALNEINTNYVIVHSADYEIKNWEKLQKNILAFKEDLEFIKKFDMDYVYKLTKKTNPANRQQNDKLKKISSRKWTAFSNRNNEEVNLAFDGNKITRWSTNEPQFSGAYLTIDMAEHYKINKISFFLKKHLYDYPRGYKIEVSNDGVTWNKVVENVDMRILFFKTVNNQNIRELELKIPPVQCRFLKITLTEKHNIYWSINELSIFGEKV